MKNSINWFEIPVQNFERAKSFYSNVLDVEITDMPHPEFQYGLLPYEADHSVVSGALVKGKGFQPSMNGAVLYLNGGDDLAGPLSRVEAAGGKVLMPKMAIGENGFIAHFADTEGNRVALHSMN